MSSRRERRLHSAERLVARGRLEAAIEELHKILKEQPDDTRTLNRIGDLYARLGRVEEAVELFERAAGHFADEGFYVKAIAIYKKILRLEPARIDVHERLAHLHQRQGLANEARNEYQLLVDHYTKLGDRERAIAGYERLVELDPADPSTRLRLADRLAEAGEVGRAIEHYRKIAAGMLERGWVDDALVVYTKALDQSPDDLELVRGVAAELAAAGRADAARRFIEIAADRNPEAAGLADSLVETAEEVRAGEEPAAAEPEEAVEAEAAPPSAEAPEEGEPGQLPTAEAPAPGEPEAPPEFEIELETFEEEAAEPEAPVEEERQPVEAGVPPPPARDPVAELLDEADALAGYGLEDKASERLRQALELEPRRLEIHRRLIELGLAGGDEESVLEDAAAAARAAEEGGDEAGWARIAEALTYAGYRVNGFAVGAPAPAPAEAPEELLVDAPDEEPAAAEPPPQAPAPDMSWLEPVDEPEAGGAAAAPAASEEDFFDLAGELQEELEDEGERLGDELSSAMEGQSLEEIVAGFKKGMEETLSPEDYDTHYNLGIAYREMGLVDEAIGEFQLAAQDPRHLVDCCSLLGHCFQEKGFADLAIKWFRRGLDSPHIGEEETLGMLYSLGSLQLSLGDVEAARRAFTEISNADAGYRDVAAKLEELGEE